MVCQECFMQCHTYAYVDGLVQDCSNSIANALELLQSCTMPSMWYLNYNARNNLIHLGLALYHWSAEATREIDGFTMHICITTEMRPVFHDTYRGYPAKRALSAKMSYEEEMTNEVMSPVIFKLISKPQSVSPTLDSCDTSPAHSIASVIPSLTGWNRTHIFWDHT